MVQVLRFTGQADTTRAVDTLRLHPEPLATRTAGVDVVRLRLRPAPAAIICLNDLADAIVLFNPSSPP